MATGYIGKIEPFDDSLETWTSYTERLEQYIAVNDVDNEKKVPALLTLLGGKTYGLLRNLTLPDKPATKTYEQILKLLKDHLSPKPLLVAERFCFYKRYQLHGESIDTYVAELRRLAEHCEFRNLNEYLRDQFVVGLRDENIQKKLLAVAELTFENAIKSAVAVETANKDATELRGKMSSESSVNRLHQQKKSPRVNSEKETPKFSCYRCNGKNHSAENCKFRDATCHNCNKRGHIRSACRSLKSVKSTKKPHKKVHSLDHDGDSDNDGDYLQVGINCVENQNADDSIWITPNVNGKEIKMELDTGSAISAISVSDYKRYFDGEKLERATIKLKTYSGEILKPEGYMNVKVKYNGQCEFLKLYVVESSGPALFGREWLKKINLDWKMLKWINKLSLSGNISERIDSLLKEYSAVFKNEIGCVTDLKANLTLKKDAAPKFVKARPVPFSIKPQVESELAKLEKEGVISKVDTSAWASPIVPVMKPNGSVRICGDFKSTVNPMLDVDQYPLPRIDEIFATLAGGQKFTKLDLRQAYLHLELDDESKVLTTINTHKGLYRYNRLTFGIASAPAIWQRTMDQVLSGLNGVQCMLDDMIITGRNDEEHLKNLRNVLQRLQNFGLRANMDKCYFMKEKVVYCGHEISAEGLRKMPDKVKAVMETPIPSNVKELRAFLGLVNYYHKFLPDCATVLKPLNQLLGNSKWNWTPECDKAFNDIKTMITSDQVLTHYNPDLPVRLACDASPVGISAILSHVMPDGSERPIAFSSRSLTKSEQNYAQIRKEALSIVYGVKKFQIYLYGRKFTLITDHQPLTTIFHPEKSMPVTTASRLQRYAIFLSEFHYDIEYKSTKKHTNADALSRLPLQSKTKDAVDGDDVFHMSQIEELPINSDEIRRETRKDRVLASVLNQTMNGWENSENVLLKPYYHRRNEISASHGCLLWGIRVIIPDKFRKQVLNLLHSSHPGVVRMKLLARSHVWWPGIDNDIEMLVKSCMGCQKVQHAPSLVPLHPWEWPETPWQRVHVDFAGPFMNRMFLVMVDAHSKWPEVFEMKSINASSTINVMRLVFARNGVPAQIVSDNGPTFTSDEFNRFMKSNGIKHTRSAPYHPATNGLVERFIQTFKQSMKAMKFENVDMNKKLSNFLLTYRQTPHSTTQETPSKLFIGREVKSRINLLKPNIKNTVRKHQEKSCETREGKKERQFEVGERVIARDYRGQEQWKTGVISEREGPLMYKVQTDNGQSWRRHTEQLKSTNARETAQDDTQGNNDNEHDERVQEHPAEVRPRYPTSERRPPKRLINEM